MSTETTVQSILRQMRDLPVHGVIELARTIKVNPAELLVGVSNIEVERAVPITRSADVERPNRVASDTNRTRSDFTGALVRGVGDVSKLVDRINPAARRLLLEDVIYALPKRLVRSGMRTFQPEINGMRRDADYDTCVIAMMYGDVGELVNAGQDDAEKMEQIAYKTCFAQYISMDDMLFLSRCHNVYPRMVRNVMRDRLAGKVLTP